MSTDKKYLNAEINGLQQRFAKLLNILNQRIDLLTEQIAQVEASLNNFVAKSDLVSAEKHRIGGSNE